MRPLILGGGPAGAAAAIDLARGGMRPTLIERSRETGDALCGGFLSWRSLETLTSLGVEADALNRAPVRRLRLFARDRMIEADLPRPARGVSRRRLDTLLLERAAAAGAGIERGVTLRSLDRGTARTADGADLTADHLLLATGKHDVRGTARPHPVGDPAIGLRVRLPAAPQVADAIELHLFDRGYAGLVRQEDGSANLCLAVRRSRLKAAGEPEALLRAILGECPPLAERVGAADLSHADAVANIPYGWLAHATSAGLYRLGDQAAVIPSLAGEGMGIALASGRAAAAAVLAGEGAPAFQARLARRTARPVGLAALLWRLAERPGLAARALPFARPGLLDWLARATRID